MKIKGQNSKKNPFRQDPRVFMDRAVELAWQGKHHVEPNPMVGAVFVKNGRIVAEGCHLQFGGLHAEIDAIQHAQTSLKGASLYVTLEPCCHVGKQGACTKELLKCGLKKVFYSQLDPNPKIKGIAILEKAGIQTECFSTPPSRFLNAIYTKNLLRSLPFLHLKNALTADGKLTLKKGEGTRLMNSASFERVHALRSRYDGILIGFNTLLSDDPQLTSRIPGGHSPIRIVLDSHLKSPPSARLFQQPGTTLLATTLSPSALRKSMHSFPQQVELLSCRKNSKGQIDLLDLLHQLFERNIRSVLVEGGETVNTSFLSEGLADAVTLIFTPLVANNSELPQLVQWDHFGCFSFQDGLLESVEGDLWLTARF